MTWGNHRSGKRVLVHCDNQSVVDLWQHEPFYCPNLLALVLRLVFTAANINYTVVIRHIPPTPCLPITIKIISQMKSVLRERLNLSNDNRQMYWAAFTVALFGAQNLRLRVSANCDKDRKLLRPDLTTDDNGYRLHINASKTNPFCLDIDSFLRPTHHSVCGVKALKITRPVLEHLIYRNLHMQTGHIG